MNVPQGVSSLEEKIDCTTLPEDELVFIFDGEVGNQDFDFNFITFKNKSYVFCEKFKSRRYATF